MDTFVYDFLRSCYKGKNYYVSSSIWPTVQFIIADIYKDFVVSLEITLKFHSFMITSSVDLL